MLIEESVWLKEKLTAIDPKELFPIGNIGSSDASVAAIQPWVFDVLMNPLKERGEVLDIDIKDSPSVNIVGNLLDEKFINELRERKFKSVLCCNILTNIIDREQLAINIEKMLESGAYIFVTVSRNYPYVADPVDTFYRPTPDQLLELFRNCELLDSDIVTSENYFQFLGRNKRLIPITMVRLLLPFYKPKNWWGLVKYLPRMFKPFSVTCAVLRKK